MSISSKLSDITTAISSAYIAVSNKGGTVPSNACLNNLPSAIGTIPFTTVTPLSVSANGTYTASSGYAYSPVTVNVQGGDELFKRIITRSVISMIECDVAYVGSSAFYAYSYLHGVSLPSCSIIYDYAFNNCTNLTTVNIPNCTIISSRAFASCTKLSNASFSLCERLGQYAFAGCSSLTTVSFPECLQIMQYAFQYCSSLLEASFPKCSKIYDYTFLRCTALKSARFSLCEWIGTRAFSSCSSLTTVSFPECVSIQAEAFLSCTKLATASFPKCTYIGTQAFLSCTGLTRIYIGTSNCSLQNSKVFTNTGIGSNKGSIYVPTDYVDAYKASTNWTYFSNRIFGYTP